jgi:hypothetical protein
MYERTKMLAGRRFGKLTVTGMDGKDGKNTVWKVICDCGIEGRVRGSNLTAKVRPVTSCGCARRDGK